MKQNYEIGHMFNLLLSFDDQPEKSKMRPIVIVDIDDDDFFIVKFTSKEPKNKWSTYEKRKRPFLNWRRSHLDRPSWFINQVFTFTLIEFEALEKEFLGEIHEKDYAHIIDQLENT